uniref:Uncharacterized protein n=1 Tax=Grammatophora oceanica TaxID=210454 RepID=A0A7S1YD28_9STRA|mmetsp:Transcript_40104/g.59475  ORF Transcript_40104/g.59475 Transcript_40104/m.59475 type:complete len:106 (+) Transcript_40104:992-1309(+)
MQAKKEARSGQAVLIAVVETTHQRITTGENQDNVMRVRLCSRTFIFHPLPSEANIDPTALVRFRQHYRPFLFGASMFLARTVFSLASKIPFGAHAETFCGGRTIL